MKKFHCKLCQHESFTDNNLNDKKQFFILNKNYTSIDSESKLKAPSNNFNNVINKILNIFENNYKNYLHNKKNQMSINLTYKT
jgi:predicted component of type VI protein secretion system